MLALRRSLNVRRPGMASAFADGFVLPRWLRRPARLAKRLGRGDFEAPPYAATLAAAALFAATGLYGAYVGGEMPALAQAVTARTGFAVDEVHISGNRQTSEIDIIGRLGLDGWTSLVGFNPDEARGRVAELPWVEEASVRKVYPDSLEVAVVERQPFAIWQHNEALDIVERSGRVIAPFQLGVHTELPLIMGEGAEKAAPAFIDQLAKDSPLAPRIWAYIRMGDRRWDVRLDNGVTVKLPEKGEAKALALLAGLDAEKGLLSRDVAAVDMRLPDRLTVELTETGRKAWKDAVEARIKAAKARAAGART